MKEVKEIIEQLVKQEIRDILAENEASIKEMVKTSLLPELKAAVRDSVYKALEDLTGEPPESEETQQLAESDVIEAGGGAQEPKRDPSPDPEHHASDIGHRTSNAGPPQGRYLYCVVEGSEKMSLGRIGIEENDVYTIPYEELSAVVHNSPAEPYQSEDEEIMKGWVMAHQNVIDRAWERFGVVLPLGFDTIIQGEGTVSPEENMKNWLKDVMLRVLLCCVSPERQRVRENPPTQPKDY